MTWEEVTVSCMIGVWHKILPSNENCCKNCNNLDMLIKETSKIAEDAGLDNVDLVGITEVLESHSRPLSNEVLYELAQQLTEQQKEGVPEKNRGTKELQTKNLTDILSAINMAGEKLCDIDPDWKRSFPVKRGIRTMLHPYYEIQPEKKRNQNT